MKKIFIGGPHPISIVREKRRRPGGQKRRVTITDAGLSNLRALTSLTSLTVSGDGITDAGCQDLSQLQDLTYLTLTDTKITDAGVRELSGLTELVGSTCGGPELPMRA